MLGNLTGWHVLILGFGFLPILVAGIGIPATLIPHYNRVKRVALGQIKRTHERGWGFAVSALWIGY